MKTENYVLESRQINGVNIDIQSYSIGGRFFCHISNTDPGATIARGRGATREEAIEEALTKTRSRLRPQ